MTAAQSVEPVTLSEDAFARLVGSAGDQVLLFEVARDFVEDEWQGPVEYRFVRSEGGLLTMELRQVPRDLLSLDIEEGESLGIG